MRPRATIAAFVAVLGTMGASAQEARNLFRLVLPDFFEGKAFDGGSETIDVPSRPIRNLRIQVAEEVARNLGYGRVTVRINGKGFGNAFDRRSDKEGLLLVMNPQSLGLRPDAVFDPVENAIEVSAEDKRGRRYYQNWLVRFTQAPRNNFFIYTSSMSPDDHDGVPPDLQITEPIEPPTRMSAAAPLKVRLKGAVSAASPGVQVLFNDTVWIPPIAGKESPFDQVISVPPTARELTFTAVDKKGNRRGVTIPIISKVKVPPPPRFAGKRYAVLVGISDFGKFPDSPSPLRSAAADVSAIARVLESAAGFPHSNIRLLLDADATPDQVRIAFTDFIQKADPDDVVITYIATHGLHDPIAPDRLYLAAHGTRMKQIDSTAIDFSDIETRFAASIRSKNAIMLFDVGHRLETEIKYPGKNLINSYLLKLFAPEQGRSVLISSSTDEVSRERKTTGEVRSLFAHWVSRAFAGEADLNGDRVLTPDEFARYVSEGIRKESQGEQNPRFLLTDSSVALGVIKPN